MWILLLFFSGIFDLTARTQRCTHFFSWWDSDFLAISTWPVVNVLKLLHISLKFDFTIPQELIRKLSVLLWTFNIKVINFLMHKSCNNLSWLPLGFVLILFYLFFPFRKVSIRRDCINYNRTSFAIGPALELFTYFLKKRLLWFIKQTKTSSQQGDLD